MNSNISEGPVCPLPLPHKDTIIMGHGSGGKLTHDLIRSIFHAHFSNPFLDQGDDAARMDSSLLQGTPVISTDAHVVKPLFFPGGDIGRLAVCGTVNDISMLGAIPKYLTASFILEEGLSINALERVVRSMAEAAQEAGVDIVAGDTKVVEKGKADGLYISTAGFGIVPLDRGNISGSNAQPGDAVILSGTLGDHGIAVLSARNEITFEVDIQSDVSPLNSLVEQLLKAAPHTHVLRDPTRGGLATTLNEIASQSQISIWLDGTRIPMKPAVKAACEMLGFDPLYLANEGKLIAFVPVNESEKALSAMSAHPYGKNAVIIGTVKSSDPGSVILQTPYGSSRIISMLAGEILPRIC
jgi:hydrogenase expression/formation protein HypE